MATRSAQGASGASDRGRIRVAAVGLLGAILVVGSLASLLAHRPTPGSRPPVRSGSTLAASGLNQPIAGLAATPSGHGYWLVASDGGIFSFGDARFHGSTGAIALSRPIVGMASTPSGNGYWLVASDGGIFSFGDARFHGSTGAIALSRPIVGMASTPSGNGYWLVASDGGIFSFGDARFHGSTGAIALSRPIVGMAASPSGRGYWLVASDGGLFDFGDVAFFGSTGAVPLPAPVVGMARTASGKGYWLAGADGGLYAFGDAKGFAPTNGVLGQPAVGVAATGPAAVVLGGQAGATFSLPSTAATAGGGEAASGYSFLAANRDGSAIRFNPCQPVHYVTNLTGAPASAAGDVAAALARVSDATGLTFADDGATSEVPARDRPAYQPDRYGPRWAPVLIAWATSATSDALPGGGTVGEGGSSWVAQGAAPGVFVTGQVAVDAVSTAGLPPGFGSGVTMGELLLHELGHVVGLGHVGDTSQVMYPDLQNRPDTHYGPGDIAGLRRVGRLSGCLSVPPAG